MNSDEQYVRADKLVNDLLEEVDSDTQLVSNILSKAYTRIRKIIKDEKTKE